MGYSQSISEEMVIWLFLTLALSHSCTESQLLRRDLNQFKSSTGRKQCFILRSSLFANHCFLLYRDKLEIILGVGWGGGISVGHYYYLVYLLHVTNVKQGLFFFVWIPKDKGHLFCSKAQALIISEVISLVPTLSFLGCMSCYLNHSLSWIDLAKLEFMSWPAPKDAWDCVLKTKLWGFEQL